MPFRALYKDSIITLGARPMEKCQLQGLVRQIRRLAKPPATQVLSLGTRAGAALLLVALGVLGTGAGVISQRAWTTEEPKALAQSSDPAKKDAPKVADPKSSRTDRYGDPLPEGALARLGTVRWRLPRPAPNALTFARDGKTFYTASYYGGLWAWDTGTGQILRQVIPDDPVLLTNPQGLGMLCRVFSSDSRTLAMGRPDGTVSIMEVATGRECRRCIGHQGSVHSAALSADGRVLVTRSIDQTLRVWDTTTGRQLHQLPAPTNREPTGETQASSVDISPDGKTLAWIGWYKNNDLSIHICDVATGKERLSLRGDERAIYRVAFSPDGRTLASVNPVRLWDLKTGQQIPTYQDKFNFDSCYLRWAPNGKALVISQFTMPIRLRDAVTGKELCRIAAHHDWREMVISPDGKILVVLYGQFDPTIHRYDIATGKELLDYPAHGGIVSTVALSPDGRTLASLGGDQKLRVWDVETGKQLRETAAVNSWISYALSLDCRWLATATHEVNSLYETATGREMWQHTKAAMNPYAMAFSPDGRVLASAESDRTITLREVATGKELRRLVGLSENLSSLAFFSDSKSLTGCTFSSGSLEGKNSCEVAIWETTTGRKRRSLGKFPSYGRMVLSPNGKTMVMVSADGQAIDFWEIASGQKCLHIAQPCSVQSMILSPDGTMLITGNLEDPTGNQGGPFRCYDTYTGKLIAERKGHRGPVSALVVSQDGRRLATGSWDTTVLIWNLADLRAPGPPEIKHHSPSKLESLWSALAGGSASTAHQAMSELIADREQTVRLCRERLRPAAAPDRQRIARLLADLEDDRFAVREKATAELEKLAEIAEPALRKTLTGKPSLEVRRRIESLINKLDKPITSPVELQTLRAIEVLEQIATPEAKQVLDSLAQGAPEARLTQEAKASLERLAQPAPATP